LILSYPLGHALIKNVIAQNILQYSGFVGYAIWGLNLLVWLGVSYIAYLILFNLINTIIRVHAYMYKGFYHSTTESVAVLSDKLKLLAKEYGFYSVCVNGANVEYAFSQVKDSDVKVAAVVGFPLGAMATDVKVFEAKKAIEDGASEIDMVINVGALKDKDYDLVENEIRRIKEAIGKNVLKVIIETCYLTDEEKVKACELAVNANADFVKTSTGFGTGGATFEDVELMKKTVGDKAKVKASGGVRDFETAKKYIELGAERLGTSSGIAIVTGVENKSSGY